MSDDGMKKGPIPVLGYTNHTSGRSPPADIPNTKTHLSSSPLSSMYAIERQQQRRASGTYSRKQYVIFGGPGSAGSNLSSSPGSSLPKSNSNSIVVPATSSVRHSNMQSVFSHYNQATDSTRFHSATEIVKCAKSNTTPNLFIIGGTKSLQLLKLSNSEISLEYDLSTGRSSQTGLITDIKFGHQNYGRHVAYSTLSGSIHLYNLDKGRVKTSLNEHQRAVNSIDFSIVSPYYLLSGSQDGKMKLWDLRVNSSKSAITMNGNADAVRCVKFNPRLPRTVCGIFDSGIIQKWDIRKPDFRERSLPAHAGPGLTLDWHPELDYIVSGGRDRRLQVWNMTASGELSRKPEHVIITSGPISNATWCKGRGNNSVINTDIAVSFRDDTTVQIWNLHRKFLAKNIIECHDGQVTGLVWKTPKYLVSCSKDKTLVQSNALMEPKLVDNLPNIVTSWNWRANSDLMMISQNRDQFEAVQGGETKSDLLSVNRNSTSVPQSPSDYQFPTSLSMQRNNSSHAQTIPPKRPSTTTSLQALSLHSYPTDSSDSIKPKLSRMSSMGPVSWSSSSRQQKHSNVKSALAVSIHVPVMQNEVEVVKFLTNNYLIEVPNGMDITQICEHNAAVAGSAQKFRECQTWRTIRESILWEYSEKAVGMDDYQSMISGSHMTSHPHDDPQQRRNHSTITYDTHTTTGASANDQLGTSLGSMTESSVSHYKSRHQGSFTLDAHEQSRIRTLQQERHKALSNLVSDVDSRSNSKTTFDTMSDGGIDPNENALIDDDDVTTNNTNSRSNSKTDNVNMPRADSINGQPHDSGYVSEKQIADSPESIADYIPPSEIVHPLRKFNRSGSSSSTGKFRFSFSAASVDFDNEKPVNLSKSPKSSLSSSILAKSSTLQFASSYRQTARLEPASSVSMDMSPVKKPPLTSTTKETNTSEVTLAPALTATVTNESQLTACLKGVSGNSSPISRSPHHHHNGLHHQHQRHHQNYQHPPRSSEDIDDESNLGDDEDQDKSAGSDTDSLSDSDQECEDNREYEEDGVINSKKLRVPWAPTSMIHEAIKYSAEQGDVIMAGTMALLFKPLYPHSMTRKQAQEYILMYHEFLCRRYLFGSSAYVVEVASRTYKLFKTLGQNKTCIRTFCQHCGQLILNESTQMKSEKDSRVQFGFWFCENCGKNQGCCIYCNEPLMGTCIALLGCGHKGHFGCLKSWFVGEMETECPGCGTPALWETEICI
ncbi:unnamed protein product [Ambrosiozyma monospora]|uniref:Restriction of telomere capping protein 1 n=1 Tax=Ambrosiozyma monospora TaxID=43982 RepID=A0A9W6YW15_AMBMO|nr:unnamed protein product [Ambrosiozyma monospora]